MITWIYVAIIIYLLGLTVWNTYTEKAPMAQLTCVLVAIPLFLRLVGLK